VKKDQNSLAQLVQLRQRELDQRQAELASRQAVRERFQRNVDQLEQLWRNSTASGTLAPALSLNSANYKQTVLQLASTHREDLVRHEAKVDSARQAVVQASRQHGAVEQVFERRRQALLREENAREQKRQDELASQVWHRKLV
jgi:flagellar export protein FliJ